MTDPSLTDTAMNMLIVAISVGLLAFLVIMTAGLLAWLIHSLIGGG
jgi:hypothetical protein